MFSFTITLAPSFPKFFLCVCLFFVLRVRIVRPNNFTHWCTDETGRQGSSPHLPPHTRQVARRLCGRPPGAPVVGAAEPGWPAGVTSHSCRGTSGSRNTGRTTREVGVTGVDMSPVRLTGSRRKLTFTELQRIGAKGVDILPYYDR